MKSLFNLFVLCVFTHGLSANSQYYSRVNSDYMYDYGEYSMNRFLSWYQFTNGVFLGHLSYPPDWCRGNSLTVLADYILYNSQSQLHPNLNHVSTHQLSESDDVFIWNIIKDIQDNQGDEFFQTADYFDDILWWSLAYIRCYYVATSRNDTERANRFLSSASAIHDVVTLDSCDHSSSCGGGCYWSRDFAYKNAITNELYFTAASSLALVTRNETFMTRASRSLDWILASGMINDNTSLIVDGLDNDENCKATGQVYTYNQGVILGGLANMHLMSKDHRYNRTFINSNTDYITLGETIISAANSQLTNSDGVLTESGCGDGALFKGIYTRYLRYFIDVTRTQNSERYIAFLETQFTSLWSNSRDPLVGYYGKSWVGDTNTHNTNTLTAERPRDHNLQVSGMDLVNALSGLTASRIVKKDTKDSGKDCSGHGSLINGECYCRWRFSDPVCSTEAAWGDYYGGKYVTLSSTVGQMMCGVENAAKANTFRVTTCLSDELVPASTFLVRPAAATDGKWVQLITSHGDYLGYASSSGAVVVYSQEAVSANTTIAALTLFEPIVQQDAQTPVFEFVAFRTVNGSSSAGGYVTVLGGNNAPEAVAVGIRDSVTREALFVTNLNQVCD